MNGAQDGVLSRILERRCDAHNSWAIKREVEGGRGGGSHDMCVHHIPALSNLKFISCVAGFKCGRMNRWSSTASSAPNRTA